MPAFAGATIQFFWTAWPTHGEFEIRIRSAPGLPAVASAPKRSCSAAVPNLVHVAVMPQRFVNASTTRRTDASGGTV